MQEESAKLIVAYSGDKAIEIQDREAEVVNAWRNLQVHVDGRKNNLSDAGDLYRFFNMVRDLLLWMKDMNVQISTQEKPRYGGLSCDVRLLSECYSESLGFCSC